MLSRLSFGCELFQNKHIWEVVFHAFGYWARSDSEVFTTCRALHPYTKEYHKSWCLSSDQWKKAWLRMWSLPASMPQNPVVWSVKERLNSLLLTLLYDMLIFGDSQPFDACFVRQSYSPIFMFYFLEVCSMVTFGRIFSDLGNCEENNCSRNSVAIAL